MMGCSEPYKAISAAVGALPTRYVFDVNVASNS
jgi:hypothetical protein